MYSNHWEGKEAWEIDRAFSNQVILADRALSRSGCPLALPTCVPMSETLSVQFSTTTLAIDSSSLDTHAPYQYSVLHTWNPS